MDIIYQAASLPYPIYSLKTELPPITYGKKPNWNICMVLIKLKTHLYIIVQTCKFQCKLHFWITKIQNYFSKITFYPQNNSWGQ